MAERHLVLPGGGPAGGARRASGWASGRASGRANRIDRRAIARREGGAA